MGKVMPGPDGKAMGLAFTLDGQEFRALNGGPQFKFSPAISLFVDRKTQEEVDELWEAFRRRPALLADKDRRKAQKVMDIKALEAACG